ncbi:MAG: hypothetical protein JW904_09165 [Spirochaetales bacterium]|nr:hypothetical protein [Spirochaetales bacterium]
MISREDFIFTVGFSGNTAIVSKSMTNRFKRLNAQELAEKGFFKPAVFMAYYDESPEDLEKVLACYNEGNKYPLESVEKLRRTFGLLENVDDIDRILYI